MLKLNAYRYFSILICLDGAPGSKRFKNFKGTIWYGLLHVVNQILLPLTFHSC